MGKFGNIMIDLETLSTHTNAAIIEIGAVEFNKDTGEIGKIFDEIIEPSDWCNNNRHVDGNTILWWFEQDENLKKRFKDNKDYSRNTFYSQYGLPNCSNLKQALKNLTDFVSSCRQAFKNDSVVVWGNGSTMDITILQSAYEHFGLPVPWGYKSVNDVRTIVALNPSIKENTKFEGTKHSAVGDCLHQIKYLTETIKSLKK